MPSFEAVIILPEPLDSSARFMRLHNKALKEAMKETLIKHWKTRIPTHFQAKAKTRYRHFERAPATLESKRRGGRTLPDLYKSGRTRDKMTKEKPKIRIGGSGRKGQIRGTMILRFPADFRQAQKATGVTRSKMADEISRWTAQEEEDAAKYFRNRYIHHMQVMLKTRPKIRARVGTKNLMNLRG